MFLFSVPHLVITGSASTVRKLTAHQCRAIGSCRILDMDFGELLYSDVGPMSRLHCSDYLLRPAPLMFTTSFAPSPIASALRSRLRLL